MKVFIVLEYCGKECWVERVYRNIKLARNRVELLKKWYPESDVTFHVIQKTLKGKP